MFARTGGELSESFGVAAEGDGKFAAEIRARIELGLEKSAEIFTHLIGLRRRDGASDTERGHQANCADGKLCGLNDGVVAENAYCKAAATEVGDATQRRLRTERGKDSFPSQARFFR